MSHGWELSTQPSVATAFKFFNKKLKIIIFKTKDDKVSVDVRFEGETVWLTQQQMAELYQTSRTNVVEHIKHIYDEEELGIDATCRNFRQVQKEGNRNVS